MMKKDFIKDDKEKLRYDLIPPEVLESLARVMTFGAKKYGDHNWKKGEKHRYRAAYYRHDIAEAKGELVDQESGFLHAEHKLCNAAFEYYIQLQKVKNSAPAKQKR